MVSKTKEQLVEKAYNAYKAKLQEMIDEKEYWHITGDQMSWFHAEAVVDAVLAELDITLAPILGETKR